MIALLQQRKFIINFSKANTKFCWSYFLGDKNIENILVSKKIYLDGKNYEYLADYMYDYKIKPLHMFPKRKGMKKL